MRFPFFGFLLILQSPNSTFGKPANFAVILIHPSLISRDSQFSMILEVKGVQLPFFLLRSRSSSLCSQSPLRLGLQIGQDGASGEVMLQAGAHRNAGEEHQHEGLQGCVFGLRCAF